MIHMERKNITVTERHEEFISDLNLQVSGILRDKLDDMIEDLNWQSVEEMKQEKQQET